MKAKGLQIRAWHLNRRTATRLSNLAEGINPQVRGWIDGAFYRSALYSLARRIDEHLVCLGDAEATPRQALAGMGLVGDSTPACAKAVRPLSLLGPPPAGSWEP
jgi:hypothetical protein